MSKEVVLLYNLPLLVHVTFEDDGPEVYKVIEDADHIEFANIGWVGTDENPFAAERASGDPDVDAALEVAEDSTWPARDSY